MKTCLIFLIAAFAGWSASAAVPALHSDWTGGFLPNSEPTSLARDSAGDVLAAGGVFVGDSPVTQIALTKTSGADGHRLWAREPGPAHSIARAIAVDGSGNAIVTGEIASPTGQTNYYTGKFRGTDGSTLWEVQYDGPSHGVDAAIALAVDSTGNVTVIGNSEGGMTALKYAGANGALLWMRHIAGFSAAAIAEDSAANPAITGSLGQTADYYTVKLNRTSGAVLWQRSYDGPAHGADQAQAVAVDAAGNVIVSGTSFSNRGGFNPYDLFTTKYASANGATLWERVVAQERYGPVATALDSAGNAFVSDGEYVFKYAGATGATLWQTFVPTANGLAVDAHGNVFAGGIFALDGPMDFPNAQSYLLDGTDGTATLLGEFETRAYISVLSQVVVTPDGGAVFTDGTDFQKFAPLPAAPLVSIYASAGDAPPGTGLAGGFPAGTKFSSFGVPAIGPGAKVGYLSAAGHFSFLTVDNAVAAEVGQSAPMVSGGVYSVLDEGSFNVDGLFTFLAQFSGPGITAANNTGVFVSGGGLPLTARTGTPAADGDGSIIQSISTALDLSGYLAKLVHGPGGTTAANDTEAVVPGSFQSPFLRTGKPIPQTGSPKIVLSFDTYTDPAGSPGHARYGDRFSANVNFTDGTHALCAQAGRYTPLLLGPVTGQSFNLATAGGTLAGARWQSFGLPSYAADDFDPIASPTLTFAGVLQAGPAGVTATRAKGIFISSLDSGIVVALGRTGDPVPSLAGVTYASFLDPVGSPVGAAFVATLAGAGITAANDTALLTGSAAAPGAKILAREGGAAAGVAGAQWAAFTSLAFPDWDGGGPLFLAQIKSSVTAGTTGLWSANAAGQLSLLLRTGAKLTVNGVAKTIGDITALAAIQSAQGTGRSYDREHHVIARVTFTDNTQSLVRITAP